MTIVQNIYAITQKDQMADLELIQLATLVMVKDMEW